MSEQTINAVTGAFSFTGRYIAEILLEKGEQIRTLTGHPDPKSPLIHKIEVFPYNFSNYDQLVASLKGIDTFFNTYWIRFPYKTMT